MIGVDLSQLVRDVGGQNLIRERPLRAKEPVPIRGQPANPLAIGSTDEEDKQREHPMYSIDCDYFRRKLALAVRMPITSSVKSGHDIDRSRKPEPGAID
jgi:hypothetical protein